MRPFEGASLFQDSAHSDLTLALWLYLRAVLLWSETEAESRPSLFRGFPDELPQSGRGAEALAEPLGVLRRLVNSPELETPARVAAACMQISEWASTVGREHTEREFGEAAAYLLPTDADAALFAGRAARRSGDYSRAEQWYKRAVGIARRGGDKEAHVLGLIRLGALAEERGNTDRARRLHWRAWRGGRRFKLDKLSAYARHELLVIAIYAGTFEEANEHAATALRLYGRFDDRFPQLAHDTAFLWAHYGYFSLALPIYEAVLRYITRPSERVQVIANIGRAGAACGDVDRFYWAWSECEAAFADAAEHSATAFLNLAHGARTLGFRTKAHELAVRGVKLARERGTQVVEAHLNKLLAELSTASGSDTNREPPPGMVDLAAQFSARLRRGPPP